MEAEIEVLEPGLFSTIQDEGRFHFRKFGVPVSGPMDRKAAKIANLVLNNPSDAAVMEITQQGPVLKFSGSTQIAVSGADLSAEINGQVISNNRAYEVGTGDILKFGRRKIGCRSYLAIAGGFQTSSFLNSKSWYEGISDYFRIEKGHKIKFNFLQESSWGTNSAIKMDWQYLQQQEVLVFPGPEFHLLSKQQQEILSSTEFSIDRNNNRMAIQLQELVQNQLEPILTGPVLPGTVQLTPSGKLIILMRDCQTTGGYPRVLQVSENGQDILAQKVMGDKISFKMQEYLSL